MSNVQFPATDADSASQTDAPAISQVETKVEKHQHEAGASDAADQEDDENVEDEQAAASTGNQPPLLQPAASRMISCLRAPCLKKPTPSSGFTSPHGTSSPSGSASGSISPAFGSSPTGVAMEMSLSSICSFAAIKSVISASPNRHVHFDEDPPEAGVTHSQENYDRRPIECTRGGSLFDLSLPPRGTCPSYSGDADDEACHDDDDDDANNGEKLRGFARWARLKNGGTILGGATLKLATSSSTTDASSTKTDLASQAQAESGAANTCSLPVHGIRSFGGLAGSIGHDDEVQSLQSDQAETKSRRRRLTDDDDDFDHVSAALGAEQAEGDEEQAAFRQAVYAALSMSPNATPMPSPSLRTRWECVTSYFEQASTDAAAAQTEGETRPDRSGSTTPGLGTRPTKDTAQEDKDMAAPPLSLADESTHGNICTAGTSTLDTPTAAAAPKSAISSSALASSDQLARVVLSPSSSIESSMNPSSSPMSSRCSSTDTWSSHGGRGQDSQDGEEDAFERAFAESVALFKPSASFTPSLAANNSSAPAAANTVVKDELLHELDDHHWLNEVSSPSDAADSAEYEQGMSSSSTGGGCGAGWLSSCGTSPDTHPSEGLQSLSKVSHYNLDAPTLSVPPMVTCQKNKSWVADHGENATPVAKPAFLSSQRRFASLSAPASALHSPCVLSADESEGGARSPSPCGPQDKVQRSASGTRKLRKHAKRIASTGDSPVDSDEGSLATSSRLRRCGGSGQRSKSMSSTTPSLKMSSFSTCSFRGDLDDDGALGGF